MDKITFEFQILSGATMNDDIAEILKELNKSDEIASVTVTTLGELSLELIELDTVH